MNVANIYLSTLFYNAWHFGIDLAISRNELLEVPSGELFLSEEPQMTPHLKWLWSEEFIRNWNILMNFNV